MRKLSVMNRIIQLYTYVLILFEYKLSFIHCLTDDDERIPYKFALEPTLPEMVVFNFDEIIWPFKVDKVMIPPYKITSVKYQVCDRMGKLYDLFPEPPKILENLHARWYKVSAFVQSTDPGKIENLMELYGIDKYFQYFEIFPRTPGCKVKHIKRISQIAEVNLKDILYFDNNQDDIEEIKALKVQTVFVDPKEGLTYKHINQGFKLYYDAKNYTLQYHYQHLNKTTYQFDKNGNIIY